MFFDINRTTLQPPGRYIPKCVCGKQKEIA